MSTETNAPTVEAEPTVDWTSATVAGVTAGAITAVGLRALSPEPVLGEAIPALYGIDAPAPGVGALLHVIHCVALALLYAGFMAATGLDDRANETRGGALGAAYGIVLWVAVAVVGVPLALQSVGYAAAPAFPYVDPVALAGYVAYGVLVGYFHAALRTDTWNREPGPTASWW